MKFSENDNFNVFAHGAYVGFDANELDRWCDAMDAEKKWDELRAKMQPTFGLSMFKAHQRERIKNIHIQEVWPQIMHMLAEIDEKHSLSNNNNKLSGASFNHMVGVILGIAEVGGRDAYIEEGLKNKMPPPSSSPRNSKP